MKTIPSSSMQIQIYTRFLNNVDLTRLALLYFDHRISGFQIDVSNGEVRQVNNID